jgi:uncharacterized protein (TIRG00374 family)
MASGASPAPSRSRRRLLWLLVYLALLALALQAMEVHRLLAVLGKLRAWHLALLVGLIVLHLAGRALRYHSLLLRARPAGYRARDGMRIFFHGLSASIVTPGRAGDLLKVELVRSYGVRRALGLGLIAVERVLDLLVVVGTIVIAGWALSSAGRRQELEIGAAILFAGLLAATAALSVARLRRRALALVGTALSKVWPRIRREKVEDVGGHLFEVWDDLFKTPLVMAKYAAATAAIWFVDFVKLWVVLHCVGSDVALVLVLFVYPLSLVAGIVSMLPFGDGVVGATAAGLLTHFAGVDLETATASVIIDRGASTLLPVLAGLLFGMLPRSSAAIEAP